VKPFVQLVLDLFEPVQRPIRGEIGQKGVFEKLNTDNNRALNPNAHENEAATQPIHNLLRHPNAQRSVVLKNTEIAYAFKRAKRKTIGMTVGYDGLSVSAPRWIGWGEIEAALHARSDWIVQKIFEMQERQKEQAKRVIEWRHGASIPILGYQIPMILDGTHSFEGSGAVLQNANGEHSGVVFRQRLGEDLTINLDNQSRLLLSLPESAKVSQIQDLVQAWLMKQAVKLFDARLNHFAPKLGVRWTKLSLSSAKTRWGSAGSDGSIRLNWRLIHFKLDVIDYVVAHELSHLRVMNHSAKFWETVGEVVPDFKERRAALGMNNAAQW
jgi:hypothetical protein